MFVFTLTDIWRFSDADRECKNGRRSTPEIIKYDLIAQCHILIPTHFRFTHTQSIKQKPLNIHIVCGYRLLAQTLSNKKKMQKI